MTPPFHGKALIVVGDAAETLDTLYPYYRLIEAGIQPVVTGPERRRYQMVMHEVKPGWTITKEWEGYTIDVDVPFSEVKEAEYLGIMFSGGRAPEYIRYDPDLVRITKHFFASNKPIASVCHGVEIPAYARCVQGRRMATVAKCQFDLEVCGGIYVDAPCVVDGNLVSGRTYRDNGHYLGPWIKMLEAARNEAAKTPPSQLTEDDAEPVPVTRSEEPGRRESFAGKLRRVGLVSLSVLLGAAVATSTAHAGAGASFKTWIDLQPEFPIGAWSYVWGQTKPQGWFNTYKAANLNMIQAHANQRAFTKAAGLNLILGTWDKYWDQPAADAALQSAINLANDPANRIVGFLLKDDLPNFSTTDFSNYYAQYDAINLVTNTRIFPGTPPGVIVLDDFLPNWAVPTSRFGKPYWTLIDEGFLRCNPAVAAHCHYPILTDGSTSSDYFSQLEGFRNRSYDRVGNSGPGIFAIASLVSYNPGGGYLRPNRQASMTDAQWQVNVQLAYGAKGLWWYNYQKKPTGMTAFGDGLVDVNDQPTALYSMVAEVNRRTLNIGRTLKGLLSTQVSFIANSGGGIPSGVKTYALGDASTLFDVSGPGGVCVARLDWPWASQWYYVLVVNMQHGADSIAQGNFTRTITCKFHTSLLNKRTVSVDDGETYELTLPAPVANWHTMNFTVAGGDAILFALKKP